MGRRLCVYTEGREKVNGENRFFREKRNFFLRADGELDGGGFRDGWASGTEAAFSGLLHRWEKVRKFASHSARKVRGHVK